MTGKNGKASESSSSSFFQSLPLRIEQIVLDDGGESDFELVPTAKRRLDRLLSSSDASEENDNVIVISSKPSLGFLTSKSEQKKLPTFLMGVADTTDDDIIVVSSKPSIGLLREEVRDTSFWSWMHEFVTRNLAMAFPVAGLLAVLFGLCVLSELRHRRKLATKSSGIKPDRIRQTKQGSMAPPSSDKSTITDAETVGNSAEGGDTRNKCQSDSKSRQKEQGVASPCKDEGAADNKDSIPASDDDPSKPAIPKLRSEEEVASPVLVTVVRSPTNDRQRNAHGALSPAAATVEVTAAFPDAHQRTLHAAVNQIANDIQLVQQVFKEKGLDPQQATQIAVALHSSRHLLLADEHRFQWMQQFWRESHESLASSLEEATAKHSLNHSDWQDKLRDRRDECWNAVFRLIWELALSHLVVKIAKPILPFLFESGSSGSLSSSSQLFQLVLTNLCNCKASTENVQPSMLGSSWLLFGSWGTLDVFGKLSGWESTIALEQGACYGSCMITFTAACMFAFMCHQLLRAFAAPTILHHATNVFALSMVYGPSNPTGWIQRIWEKQPGSVALVISSLAGMLILIQSKYQSLRNSVAKCSATEFREKWDRCLGEMNALRFRIAFTRWGVLLIVVGVLLDWWSGLLGKLCEYACYRDWNLDGLCNKV